MVDGAAAASSAGSSSRRLQSGCGNVDKPLIADFSGTLQQSLSPTRCLVQFFFCVDYTLYYKHARTHDLMQGTAEVSLSPWPFPGLMCREPGPKGNLVNHPEEKLDP